VVISPQFNTFVSLMQLSVYWYWYLGWLCRHRAGVDRRKSEELAKALGVPQIVISWQAYLLWLRRWQVQREL